MYVLIFNRPVSLNARNSSIGEGNADMEDYVGSQWTANSAGLLDPESRGMFHDTSTSYLSTISSSAAPKRKRMKRRCCSKPKGTASQATTWPVSPTHPKGFFRVSRWVHRVEDTDGTELPVRCVPENRPLPKDFWSDVLVPPSSFLMRDPQISKSLPAAAPTAKSATVAGRQMQNSGY